MATLTLDELIDRVEHAHDADEEILNAIDSEIYLKFYNTEAAPYVTSDTDTAIRFLDEQVKCLRILNLTDDAQLAYGVKLNIYPNGLHESGVTIRTWNSSFALAITEATLRAIKELNNGMD